jgi:AcrR family transcriptional regulator
MSAQLSCADRRRSHIIDVDVRINLNLTRCPGLRRRDIVATMRQLNAAGDARRPSPSRGDKAKRTRERITKAAEVVFVRDGYLDARVADIALEAKVAHGSFYTYFESKEDVFRVVATAVVEDMYRSLDAAALEDQASELIRAANELFIDLYQRHAPTLALIEQVATISEDFRKMRLELRQRLVKRVEHAIARMASNGETQIDTLDRRVLANALAGMVENFAYAWFILEEPFVRARAINTLDEIWMRSLGIKAPSGQRVVTSRAHRPATKTPTAKPRPKAEV